MLCSAMEQCQGVASSGQFPVGSRQLAVGNTPFVNKKVETRLIVSLLFLFTCWRSIGIFANLLPHFLTFHVSRFTFHVSRFTFHVSRLTSHVVQSCRINNGVSACSARFLLTLLWKRSKIKLRLRSTTTNKSQGWS